MDNISRAPRPGHPRGQNIVSAAAYRAGESIKCLSDGKTKDYRRKTEVVYSSITIPAGAPPELLDRGRLWNSLDTVEAAKNARLAKDVECALPRELTLQQCIALVQVQSCQFAKYGLIADASIHAKAGNWHVHWLLANRPLKGVEQNGQGQTITKITRDTRPGADRLSKPAGRQGRRLAAHGAAPSLHHLPKLDVAPLLGQMDVLMQSQRPSGVRVEQPGVPPDVQRLDAVQQQPAQSAIVIDCWAEQKSSSKRPYILDNQGNRIPVIDKATGKQKIGKNGRREWRREPSQKTAWILDKKAWFEAQREGWEQAVNAALESTGRPERVSRLSYAERGIPKVPTVHLGPTAAALERRRPGSSRRGRCNQAIKVINAELATELAAIDAAAQVTIQQPTPAPPPAPAKDPKPAQPITPTPAGKSLTEAIRPLRQPAKGNNVTPKPTPRQAIRLRIRQTINVLPLITDDHRAEAIGNLLAATLQGPPKTNPTQWAKNLGYELQAHREALSIKPLDGMDATQTASLQAILDSCGKLAHNDAHLGRENEHDLSGKSRQEVEIEMEYME